MTWWRDFFREIFSEKAPGCQPWVAVPANCWLVPAKSLWAYPQGSDGGAFGAPKAIPRHERFMDEENETDRLPEKKGRCRWSCGWGAVQLKSMNRLAFISLLLVDSQAMARDCSVQQKHIIDTQKALAHIKAMVAHEKATLDRYQNILASRCSQESDDARINDKCADLTDAIEKLQAKLDYDSDQISPAKGQYYYARVAFMLCELTPSFLQ